MWGDVGQGSNPMRASRGSAGGVRVGGSARGGSPQPSATPLSTWHAVEVCQESVGLVCSLGRLVCLYNRSLLLPSRVSIGSWWVSFASIEGLF